MWWQRNVACTLGPVPTAGPAGVPGTAARVPVAVAVAVAVAVPVAVQCHCQLRLLRLISDRLCQWPSTECGAIAITIAIIDECIL